MNHSIHPGYPYKHFCQAKILPTTLDDCQSIKVPILLQKLSIQIPVYATIIFPEDEEVVDIIKVKNRAFIDTCRLIKPKSKKHPYELHINGFVRLTVHYAFKLPEDTFLKIISFKIPFDCMVHVECFKNKPVGSFSDANHSCQPSSDTDPFCEMVWTNFIDIDKAIKHKCLHPSCNTCQCGRCHSVKKYPIEEYSKKMMVDLTFKLMQVQEITIN